MSLLCWSFVFYLIESSYEVATRELFLDNDLIPSPLETALDLHKILTHSTGCRVLTFIMPYSCHDSGWMDQSLDTFVVVYSSKAMSYIISTVRVYWSVRS